MYNIVSFARDTGPQYGELIDLYQELEEESNLQDSLFSELSSRYPHLNLSRPTRVLDSIKRIIAPTRPSLRGPAKVTGSGLAAYRNRVWRPRIRTSVKGGSNNCVSYSIHYWDYGA